MKGFKHTGKGPKYGSFAFPSKAGFGPSSGRVKNISGYTRRAPKRVMRKAVGGLASDGIVEAPGFSDFSKGGRVPGVSDPMSAREAMGHKLGGKAKRRMGYAEGGKVSAAEAKKIAQGVVKDHVQYPAPQGHKGFNRKAVIGK